MNKKSIFKKLLTDVPSFKKSYKELVDYNDGEILSYIIFGELTRFFIDQYRKNNREVVKAIQDFLVYLLKYNDKYRTELVLFGFLENLDQANEDYDDIKKSLNKKLRTELEKVETFWRNGELIGKNFHIQKGKDSSRALEKWIKNNPNSKDINAAKSVLNDLKKALNNE